VEKADGTTEYSHFPVAISPQQPFLDMRSIAHQAAPDVWAEVWFEGDLFEMEDQRAWIDASYKTYCTPLRLGHPVEIRKGTRVRQSVTLSLRGLERGISISTETTNVPVTISLVDKPAVPLPLQYSDYLYS
jgi:D-apionolactonase